MGGTNQLKFRSLAQIGCYGGYQVATFEAHHVRDHNHGTIYTALRGAVFPGILERPSAVRLQQICSFSLKTVISKDTSRKGRSEMVGRTWPLAPKRSAWCGRSHEIYAAPVTVAV